MDKNVLIFGDSITWGASDLEKGGWANRLRLYFMEHDDDVMVYQLGVSGSNTSQLLERLEIECRARRPDNPPALIIFATGINDSCFHQSKKDRFIPLEQFQENLNNMVATARKFRSKVLFVGLTRCDESKTKPIPWHTDRFYDNESIEQYDSTIKDFCGAGKLTYIPVSDLVSNQDMKDGLHPDSRAHERIYQRILPEVQCLLQKEKLNSLQRPCNSV